MKIGDVNNPIMSGAAVSVARGARFAWPMLAVALVCLLSEPCVAAMTAPINIEANATNSINI